MTLKEVINNLGKLPNALAPVSYAKGTALHLPKYIRKAPQQKELVGVDVFVHWNGAEANELAQMVQQIEKENIKLLMITNRGIKVWPNGFKETFCTDHWRCRFMPTENNSITKQDIIELLTNATAHNIDTIKTENLYSFNGKPAFSLGQGQ